MAGGDLGEGTRLAAATGAWICFEDEADQTLRPPKARTWGRRGPYPRGQRVRQGQLTATVRNRLRRIQYRPELITAFLGQTGLALEPEPP